VTGLPDSSFCCGGYGNEKYVSISNPLYK